MRIKDLNDIELHKFINEYYENTTTVRELIDKYNLEDSTNFIQSITIYSNDICEVCGGRVKYNLQSRAYIKDLDSNDKICSECGHTTDKECYCKKCIEFREKKEEKEKKEKVEKLNSAMNRSPVSIRDLELDEILFVLSLNSKYSKDIGLIYEKDQFKNVCCNPDDRIEFLRKLNKKKILGINIEKTNLDNFIIKEEGIEYYLNEMYYYLNIKEDLNNIDINELITSKFSEEDIMEFWKDICLDECMRYMDIRTETMNLGIVEGDIRNDISNYIDDLLLEYSQSNIMSIIYRTVNAASNFKIEYGVENEKAHKAIYSNIKNFINKKYKVEAYNRPYNLIQTSLSEVFFNKIIKIDVNEAYKEKISLDLINNSFNGQESIIKNDLIEKYKELEENIKEFVQNNVPKKFVLKCLNISEELYDLVLENIKNTDKNELEKNNNE